MEVRSWWPGTCWMLGAVQGSSGCPSGSPTARQRAWCESWLWGQLARDFWPITFCLARPQSPYVMVSCLLGLNGLMSKTNQEAGRRGSWLLGQFCQNWAVLWRMRLLSLLGVPRPHRPRWALYAPPVGSQVRPCDMAAVLGVGMRQGGEGGQLMIVLCYRPPITAL